MRWRIAAALGLSAFVVAGVGSAAAPVGTWRPLVSMPGIVDVVGPRADGRLVVGSRPY